MNRVVVIGAGPSGVAAAIQLRRCGKSPFLFERGEVGGLLRNANRVENYPGFPGGIGGPELVKLFREQIMAAGLDVIHEAVLELDYVSGMFVSRTSREETLSRFAVVASGTRPIKIARMEVAAGAEERVLYETHSIRGAVGKRIAVIGGGDAAFDYGLGLCKGNSVIIMNRNREPKALPVLREEAADSKIDYMGGTSVERVDLDGGGLCLNYVRGGADSIMRVDYLVVAVGREPFLDFLTSRVSENLESLVGSGRLFLVGDVKNGGYRQVGISVGDGLRAAMEICLGGEGGGE